MAMRPRGDRKGIVSPMLHSSQAQAAMEFLMTYGWAILVVLLALVFLAYFGILNVDSLLPSSCTLTGGLSCIDYTIESSQITIVMQNNLGPLITVNSITATQENGNTCSTAAPVVLKNDEKAVFTLAGCDNGVAGQKFKATVDVSYFKQDLLNHVIRGGITARVGSAVAVASQQTCQDAQDNALCDGLDLIYGIGYQATCCSEHQLCC